MARDDPRRRDRGNRVRIGEHGTSAGSERLNSSDLQRPVG